MDKNLSKYYKMLTISPPLVDDVVSLLRNRKVDLFLLSRKYHLYEIFTDEYVDDLSNYLNKHGINSVLEVGAGDGRLSKWLRDSGINCTATDDYSWKLIPRSEKEVERISISCALRKYRPQCVISSWMPYDEDWTKLFRLFKVKMYIVIGESSGGCCGADSLWNIHPGYSIKKMETRYRQVCRTDYDESCSHSRTYVFKREIS